MQRPWGRAWLQCCEESQQASDGGLVRGSTREEDSEVWVPDDTAPSPWAQRMSGWPGTPEHPLAREPCCGLRPDLPTSDQRQTHHLQLAFTSGVPRGQIQVRGQRGS